MITRDDLIALRARACSLVAALGAVLDDLQTIDEALANPGEPEIDALLIGQPKVKADEVTA